MNERGMNIPYPYNIPMRTGHGKLGFWTIVGFLERRDEVATTPKGSNTLTLDGGKPGE